jgi:hypothetical protein
MKLSSHSQFLTVAEAAGLLQRHMHGKDALVWLEADRRYDPLIPFIQMGETVYYKESDLVAFAKQIAGHAQVRTGFDRRGGIDRRSDGLGRRVHADRRRSRLEEARNDLDRRFAVRSDRRGDVDRRITGWVDRRASNDRRDQGLDHAAAA